MEGWKEPSRRTVRCSRRGKHTSRWKTAHRGCSLRGRCTDHTGKRRRYGLVATGFRLRSWKKNRYCFRFETQLTLPDTCTRIRSSCQCTSQPPSSCEVPEHTHRCQSVADKSCLPIRPRTSVPTSGGQRIQAYSRIGPVHHTSLREGRSSSEKVRVSSEELCYGRRDYRGN